MDLNMKYSIPYTPGLFNWLSENKHIVKDQISDVYFSDNRFPSNRYFSWKDEYWEELCKIANRFNCHLHYVVNPSVYDNSIYMEDGLADFLSLLDDIWNDGADWITFNNSIILRLEHFRTNIPPFKIKNSVNNKISTLEQVLFWHKDLFVQDLILDRSLNRNLDELKRITEYTKDNSITITLLGNEGCLPDCSWKQHCDNMISQYHKNTLDEVIELKKIHGVLACTNHYSARPVETLKSPFILPNAVDIYEPYADVIKIAGRMVEIDSLSRLLFAYFTRSGNNELFTFFSTQNNPLFGQITFNDLTELNFDSKTSNCKNKCASCNFCEQTFDRLMLEKTGVKTNYAEQRKVFGTR